MSEPLTRPAPDPQIQVLRRAAQLLNYLRAPKGPHRLRDVARGCGLHQSTTCRILDDLVLLGYAARPERGLYALGALSAQPDLTSRPGEAADAQLLRDLDRLCGAWQDGSATTVKICQDDATLTWIVQVGPRSYYGSGLREALANAVSGEGA